jgi:hypothetical protein
MNAQGPVRGDSDVEVAVEVVEEGDNVECIGEEHSVQYVAS